MNTYEKIYDVVCQIPKGTVATYGQVAALAGNRRWARVVGYALHVNPDPDRIPCYRVVTKDGRVSSAFGTHRGLIQNERKLLWSTKIYAIHLSRYGMNIPVY